MFDQGIAGTAPAAEGFFETQCSSASNVRCIIILMHVQNVV